MEERAMIEAVEAHIEKYESGSGHVQGFVTWSWDMMEEAERTLRQAGGLSIWGLELVEDLMYSLDNDGSFDSMNKGDMAYCYLEEHRETLAAALRQALAHKNA